MTRCCSVSELLQTGTAESVVGIALCVRGDTVQLQDEREKRLMNVVMGESWEYIRYMGLFLARMTVTGEVKRGSNGYSMRVGNAEGHCIVVETPQDQMLCRPGMMIYGGTDAATVRNEWNRRFVPQNIMYTPLALLHLGGKSQNVYGIVVMAEREPRATRGTDLKFSMRITSREAQHTEFFITVNMFNSHAAFFPLRAQKGDIVRLCNVNVTYFNGTLQIVLNQKMSSSVLVFSRTGTATTENDLRSQIVHHSEAHMSLDAFDVAAVQAMRPQSRKTQSASPTKSPTTAASPAPTPTQGCTVANYKFASFSPLRCVLESQAAVDVFKVRVVVSAILVDPPQYTRVWCKKCKSFAEGSNCRRTNEHRHTREFFIPLLLSDASGSVRALLVLDEARFFLAAFDPFDVFRDPHVGSKLRRCLQQLLLPSRWMDCCLLKNTYQHNAASFLIFGTQLRLDAM